ncbi:MAG: hypothetical protein MUO27_04930, partial [Sedimentisphaerales bacterium]|nr:hypothetical protein [Sedimentisphaerales bacterium]
RCPQSQECKQPPENLNMVSPANDFHVLGQVKLSNNVKAESSVSGLQVTRERVLLGGSLEVHEKRSHQMSVGFR